MWSRRRFTRAGPRTGVDPPPQKLERRRLSGSCGRGFSAKVEGRPPLTPAREGGPRAKAAPSHTMGPRRYSAGKLNGLQGHGYETL